MKFKPHSLQNLRVLNTRPESQQAKTAHAIKLAGGTAIPMPLIQIHSLDTQPALPELNTIDHIIFISIHAVKCFFATYQSLTWPKHIHTYALGEGTRAELMQHNITKINIPTVSDSEHLLKLASLQDIQSKTCIIVKGIGGRTLIKNTLQAKGASVIELDIYERRVTDLNQATLLKLWHNDALDIILISSETALQNLLKHLDEAQKQWIAEKPFIVLSERLKLACHKAGIKHVLIYQKDI